MPACRLAGQKRNTQRRAVPVVAIEEQKLRRRIRELARRHVRWGAGAGGWTTAGCGSRAGALTTSGCNGSGERSGSRGPLPRKRKRSRPAGGGGELLRAEYPHHVWAIDFQFDQTMDGRTLKFLNVVDEYGRVCLAIRVDRSCKAVDVINTIEDLLRLYPATTYLRMDNGPEFIAHALQEWCTDSASSTA